VIRGTGALLDPPGDYRPSAEIVGAGAPPPAHDGVLRWCPPVSDQGGDNSCVAFAFAAALYARAGAEGRPQVMASRKALWYFARAIAGRQALNAGVAPTDMFQVAANAVGYPPEWAWSLAMPLTLQPDEHAMRFAADQRDVAVGRIVGEGLVRKYELQAALAARFPVPFTIASDDGYAEQTTGIWSPRGSWRGYHEVLATHYTRDGVWTQGSYGFGHGVAGFTLIPWEIVMDGSMVLDLWAVTFAPAPPAEGA